MKPEGPSRVSSSNLYTSSSSSTVPSLYAELDVSPSVSAADLVKQYRKLSLLYHPDRFAHRKESNTESKNPKGALLDKYQAITAAYKILSDPAKRAKYDAQNAVNFRRRAQAVMEAISKYSSSSTDTSSLSTSPSSPVGTRACEKEEKKKEKGMDEIAQESTASPMNQPELNEENHGEDDEMGKFFIRQNKRNKNGEEDEEEEDEEYNPTEVKVNPSLPSWVR